MQEFNLLNNENPPSIHSSGPPRILLPLINSGRSLQLAECLDYNQSKSNQSSLFGLSYHQSNFSYLSNNEVYEGPSVFEILDLMNKEQEI